MLVVTRPDSVAWVFNPCYIEVTPTEGETTATIEVHDDHNRVEIDIDLVPGTNQVYVSRLLQMMFDNPKTTRIKTVVMNVSHGWFTDAATMVIIWGSIALGERMGMWGTYDETEGYFRREVEWFVNFPFTLDIMHADGTIRKRVDGGQYVNVGNYGGIGMESIALTGDASLSNAKHKVVFRYDKDKEGGVFDYTFDYTFRVPADTSTIITVNIRNEHEGQYLRWIDHFGQQQYYLFREGELTDKVKRSTKQIERDSTVGSMTYGGHLRPLSVQTERTQKLCAVNLSWSVIDYVKDILSSPIVDLWCNGTWVPVRIVDGSYAYKKFHTERQDLEITIELPERITQTL